MSQTTTKVIHFHLFLVSQTEEEKSSSQHQYKVPTIQYKRAKGKGEFENQRVYKIPCGSCNKSCVGETNNRISVH